MLLLSIHRSFVFALQSFWRNIWLSLVTVFIIFLAFLSVNTLVIIHAVSDNVIVAVKERIDISVYFKNNIKESAVVEVKNQLETLPEVKQVTYRSPQENLDLFTERHKNDANIQETLKELDGNPLGATLIIKAKQLTDYPTVLKAIDNPEYNELIEEKNYDDHELVISRINSITDNVRQAAIITSLVFVIIAVLIVFNTVRIAIFTHQNEIAIMKLVGASNWFVRAPFIIESMIYGVLGCLLAIAVIYPTLGFIQPKLASFFDGTAFDLIGYFNANFVEIFGGQLLAIVILNTISSVIAINKYLKV